MKPRLLDLFCGAGGAAMGYHRAGFDVVGVDINPQPRYPFEFHQTDALVVLQSFVERSWAWRGIHFDAIHASPPCQAYSSLRFLGTQAHPDLIGDVRDRLITAVVPWVMENVAGSPLLNPLIMCGSSFGLGVRRHRLFESSHLLFGAPCRHFAQTEPLDVTGTGGPSSKPRTSPGGRSRKPKSIVEASEAMGIDWMTRREISQAIPPAYTEWIGTQLIRAVDLSLSEPMVATMVAQTIRMDLPEHESG